jgi:hypothetical protein
VTVLSGDEIECTFGTAIKPAPYTVKDAGTCTADTASPIGSATPTGPVTVCCLP